MEFKTHGLCVKVAGLNQQSCPKASGAVGEEGEKSSPVRLNGESLEESVCAAVGRFWSNGMWRV